MYHVAFHFIKALGVPSWVTQMAKPKHSQKGAEDDDDDIYGDKEVDDIDGDGDIGDEKADDPDIDSDIDNEEVDGINIGMSMDVNALASDAEAMAEMLVVDKLTLLGTKPGALPLAN